MNSRAVAAKVIVKLLDGKASLAKVLPSALAENSDQPFIQEICYGVARWYFQLNFISQKLLKKSLKQKDNDIYALILVGLYELLHMRTPEHATINETVNCARDFKKLWACSLINAVLRNFLRQKEKLLKLVGENLEAKYAHPKWMLERFKKAWPNYWKQLVEANNQYPPMSLRTNLQLISREDYLKKLAASSIRVDSSLDLLCNTCVVLEKPSVVSKLPGFFEGEVSVQDCGAQFAAELLDLKPQQNVLDACAAPGGKTMHILEQEPNLKKLIAIDSREDRLQLIKENLARIKFPNIQNKNSLISFLCADAGEPKVWWNGAKFDRILLDAPCSATGVIRRHPDIKLLKREADIEILAKQQLRLLTALWPLLKSQGKLIYVTCSVLPEENDKVIEKFLAQTTGAQMIPIEASWGEPTKFGRQIIPGQDNMDGFYYSCLIG